MKTAAYSIISTLFFVFANSAMAANYGAIAYDQQTNGYGVSWDQPSQSAADQNALSQCGKKGSNCAVVAQFVDQCGAYAAGLGGIWGRWHGGSRAVAEKWAYNYCSQHGQGCQVKVWGCNSQPNNDSPAPAPDVESDYDKNRKELDREQRKAEIWRLENDGRKEEAQQCREKSTGSDCY